MACSRRAFTVALPRGKGRAGLAPQAGEPLELTPKEFALLEYFMLHPDAVLSRGQIAEHVWDEAYEARSNTIDVILARLRRKEKPAS